MKASRTWLSLSVFLTFFVDDEPRKEHSLSFMAPNNFSMLRTDKGAEEEVT